MTDRGYAIGWTAPARRALTRLPDKVGSAVVEFIYGPLAAKPHRVGKPLKLEFEGLHSARHGDYRVIYRIDDTQPLGVIIAIEHRADAYPASLRPGPRRSRRAEPPSVWMCGRPQSGGT